MLVEEETVNCCHVTSHWQNLSDKVV